MEKFAGFNHVELWHRFPFTLRSMTAPDNVDKMDRASDDSDDEKNPVPDLVLPTPSREVCLSRERLPRHFIGIWCLCANTRYEVEIEVTTEAGTQEVIRMRLQTAMSPFNGDWPNFVAEAPHLTDVNVLDCCSCQRSDWMVTLRDLADRKVLLQTRWWLCKMFYNGLFVLPARSPMISLPNGRLRYVLDLSVAIDWTHSKKMRRAIASGKYAIVANRCLRASLNDAFFYHSGRGTTWMTHELIDALCDADESKEAPYGLQMMAVELWDRAENIPVAGCLGFCVGSAYHDFTMYTIRRDADSCGTLLTKVLGAALQACGYGMWYWGFRVAYMQQFEGRYGAKEVPRRDFIKRWCELRDDLPLVPVHTFLNTGAGLVGSLNMGST
jgi:Leu/Phe-tRNA-protein transferase